MPELPEVETIVRSLRPKLVGKKFKGVWSDREKPLKQAGGVSVLLRAIKNKKIVSVRRRAKFIVIDIDGPKALFIHQKISGHLLFGKWKFNGEKWESRMKGPLKDDPENKYIRVLFDLNDGNQLALADVRRFGKIVLVNDNDISELKEIRDLGPEPLELSFKEFAKLFSNGGKVKKGRIKQVVMDPFFIVGIGNIYSDEILWTANIHPLSRAENLTGKNLKDIYKAMKKILARAILMGGSSNDDYRLPSGEKGKFQNFQKAYHQTGKKCAKKDEGVIKRIKIGGRSAHFCSKHQILL